MISLRILLDLQLIRNLAHEKLISRKSFFTFIKIIFIFERLCLLDKRINLHFSQIIIEVKEDGGQDLLIFWELKCNCLREVFDQSI